jgi:hypothetical protein
MSRKHVIRTKTLVLLLSLSASHALAQAKKVTIHLYSRTAFAGVVPPHFQGNDLKAIVDGLAPELSVSKGKYETSAQFAARLDRIAQAPLSGGIPGDAPLAFVFPTDASTHTMRSDERQISTEYDADKQEMTVALLTETLNTESELESSNLALQAIWNRASDTVSHGVASNAFGVKAVVRYSSAQNYGLAIPLALQNRVHDVTFKITPAKARLVENRLRVAVIGVIEGNPEDVVIKQSSGTATIQDPYEWRDTAKYLCFKPSQIWVFDTETGEILAKADFRR